MDGLPRIGHIDSAQERSVRRNAKGRSQKRFDPAHPEQQEASEEEPPDRDPANSRAVGHRDDDEAGGKIDVTA